MANEPTTGIPYLGVDEPNVEARINRWLWMLVGVGMGLSIPEVNNPPTPSPVRKITVLIQGSPTGEFIGHGLEMGLWLQGWSFMPQGAGLSLYNSTDEVFQFHDGSSWTEIAVV